MEPSIILVTVMCVAQTQAQIHPESTEEQQSYTYNDAYIPSTLNFRDIYSTNSAGDESTSTTSTAKTETPSNDDFHLTNVQINLVEFRPKTEVLTTPEPIYALNASYIIKKNDTVTVITTSTTEEPDDFISVLPVKEDYQRGVLDLLFPAVRVKSFKTVFDSVRRVLSHTFR